jgi:hypothetical protein
LTPVGPEPWSAEIEALARRLQAAPYPEHWPPTELFCSVLLQDGQRLIAVARYGLTDHTASRRRGGLELIGVVGPGNLSVPSALAVYRWLRQRRDQTKDLRRLDGLYSLDEIIAHASDQATPGEAPPLLPVRLWQEGTLLFAAMTPTDPDDRLVLLERGAGSAWQWLPLVGSDFPLPTYAERGPLIAWSPPLAGGPPKRDPRPSEATARSSKGRRRIRAALVWGLLILLLGNLWATLAARKQASPSPSTEAPSEPSVKSSPATVRATDTSGREQLAELLTRLLEKQHATQGWTQNQLLDRYQHLEGEDSRFRVSDPREKILLGVIVLLSRRNTQGIEAEVRKALSGKGYDPELINLVCRRIQEHLAAEAGHSP